MTGQTSVIDHETRKRLLDAAARLFADRGFEKVTVREICSEAGANVAAVNYYFRDKWGLYKEILQPMINFMNETNKLAHDADSGTPPEERLRKYVRVVLERVLGEGMGSCHGRLMAREMFEPSPALDLVVEQVVRPNSARVCALVSELTGLPISDPRVGMSVGSIQTQIFSYVNNPIVARLLPGLRYTPEVIEHLAEHIAEFSLGGIRAIARREMGFEPGPGALAAR